MTEKHYRIEKGVLSAVLPNESKMGVTFYNFNNLGTPTFRNSDEGNGLILSVFMNLDGSGYDYTMN